MLVFRKLQAELRYFPHQPLVRRRLRMMQMMHEPTRCGRTWPYALLLAWVLRVVCIEGEDSDSRGCPHGTLPSRYHGALTGSGRGEIVSWR